MLKNRIIIVLSIALIIISWLYFAKKEVVKVVTETKYDTIVKIVDNTKPNKIEKVYVKVPIYKTDTITNKVTDTIYKEIKTNKYNYINEFKEGKIEAEIFADNIYKRDIKFTAYKEETTITKTIVKSQLYLGGIITSDLNKSISNVSINAFYTHKNKFLLTGGVGYDTKNFNLPNLDENLNNYFTKISNRNKLNASFGIAFKF